MRKFILLVMLAVIFQAAAAQDAGQTAFMRAMALVPQGDFLDHPGTYISYVDFHTAVAARGLDVPANWQSMKETAKYPILFALPPAGPKDMMLGMLNGVEQYPALLGFDFFHIAQAVEISTVPTDTAQIMIGSFDPAAITAAYTAREYEAAQDVDNGVLLCPPGGCEDGMAPDFDKVDLANPFGGSLGIQEPFFASPDVLINARKFSLSQTLTGIYADDETPTLADRPDVQAVGAALDTYAFTSAVALAAPSQLALSDLFMAFQSRYPSDATEALAAKLSAEPLPAYSILAFASVADANGKEYALAITVYADAAAAENAAAVMESRLDASMLRLDLSYNENYAEFGMLEPPQVTFDAVTGLSLVTVRLAANPPEAVDEAGEILMMHRAFLRFVRALVNRDLLWLVWGEAA